MKISKLIMLLLALLCISYSNAQTEERKNGWYYLLEGRKDSISGEPIITVKDFAFLRLDSYTNADNTTIYMIVGTVNESRQSRWADATENSIGKRICFVYDNKVISDPQVNDRIESGNFAITTNNGYDLKSIFQQLTIEMDDEKQKEKDSKAWDEANKYRSTITDTVFLKVRGHMSYSAIDPVNGNGWNEDYAYNQVVYLAALDRAKRHLSVEDNQFKCDLKSGTDINISEDIYLFIIYVFDDWNKGIREGRYKIIKDKDGNYDVMPG